MGAQGAIHYLSPTFNNCGYPPGAANYYHNAFSLMSGVLYPMSLLWTVRPASALPHFDFVAIRAPPDPGPSSATQHAPSFVPPSCGLPEVCAWLPAFALCCLCFCLLVAQPAVTLQRPS